MACTYSRGRRIRRPVLAALAATLILAAPALGAVRDRQFRPTVDTDKGRVAGLREGEIAEFRGIPYAAAPTGTLRFRPPQPRAAWSQPLDATQFGSACPQSARLGTPSVNEDCLSLNVYAPLVGQERRPVLVFIHDGSFNAGNGSVAASGPDYRGNDIAAQSGAVVVTINYRLSVLGFLAAPALDAENAQGVSSNYGLQDQQEALRWVQRNIGHFDGDPGNVTIFGESAGGISVLYHLVSPGSAGLFQRAIIESSNDGASLPLPTAEALEQPVVAALGCGSGSATDVAACLRALPVETIVNSGLNVGPIIDGVTIPGQPRDLIADGHFNKVPLIIGTNRNEGTYFIAVAANAAGRALTAADYDAVILTNFGAAATPAIEAAYPLAAYQSPAQTLAAIQTDSFFACPSDAVRRALAPQGSVWGYEFAANSPVQNFPLPPAPADLTLGDSHTTELAYVFGHDGRGNRLPTRADRLLSMHVIDYWTNLASSGDPNNELDWRGRVSLTNRVEAGAARRPSWPPFTLLSGLLQILAKPVGQEADFVTAHQCALWASLGYPERLLTAVPATP